MNRRRFLERLGISAAALPFVAGLRSLRAAELAATPRQRVVIVFSPNGTIPAAFWPDPTGETLAFKEILQPLEPYRDQTLVLKGISNKIRGDGDGHMRGMSCLLTAAELNPGNIQGGSDAPAGWASNRSIDQELKNWFQSRPETRTRFGSLEFGVAVPHRADPWTRMCYEGSNKPLAPIDDPYQMLQKLYGAVQDRQGLTSVLDGVVEELSQLTTHMSGEDRSLLEEHMTLVRELERDLQAADESSDVPFPQPELDPHVELVNDNTPAISRMQIDLLVNSLANDMTRIASLQFMRSVGQAQMRWLGVDEGHHGLSHEPDANADAFDKLVRINVWFANQLAYLAQKLAATPEPGGDGTMLDHTLLVWVNELGKGNNHTLDNIPFVMVGGGCGFRMGRCVDFHGTPHNRLWLALAQATGLELTTFGKAEFCEGGALDLMG